MADDQTPTPDADAPTAVDTEAPPRGSKEAVLADLARERDRRQEAEKLAARAGELEAELTKLRESQMSDQEKAVAAAKAEGAKEALATANGRLLRAEVRLAAAGKLADPEDAVRFLDLDEFKVDDDGNVDTRAVAAAVDALIDKKPYLAASATRPTGNADQGTRRGAPPAPDMDSLLRAAVNGRK
jgi:hypothetical protein